MPQNDPLEKNVPRACLKLAALLALACLLLTGAFYALETQHAAMIKHNLSLGTIVLLLVIINLVCFICFLLLFAAYNWVKDDLKPQRRKSIDKESL